MARRRPATPQVIPPDPRFGSEEVSRFINKLMERGKKSVAQRIMYNALDQAQQTTGQPALEVFAQAMRNSTPQLQVKPRRVGGATYQVPTDVLPGRGRTLAMRWLIQAARARTGRPMQERLAAELMDAAKGQGAATKRREDVHRMAEANRAFVHYRW
ncbi:MAG: 30S ribosomal protein S7 [Dehalococcoidia bacterium]|nr:30S ribosomal protein S7 [Dehalococcoidia bacterium]